MKGRQLTLEEVLRLEDGTKVWVEDKGWGFDNVIYIFNKQKSHLELEDRYYTLKAIELYNGRLEFYEWIEELFIPDKIETPYYSYNVIKYMATEICNLRGINLTEYNIDKIMKEFVDKE